MTADVGLKFAVGTALFVAEYYPDLSSCKLRQQTAGYGNRRIFDNNNGYLVYENPFGFLTADYHISHTEVELAPVCYNNGSPAHNSSLRFADLVS